MPTNKPEVVLPEAPPIPAHLFDKDQSIVWAAAWETLRKHVANTLTRPADGEYDRELIAEMLDDLLRAEAAAEERGTTEGRSYFNRDAIAEQARLLRAADNRDAAGVRTANLSAAPQQPSTPAADKALCNAILRHQFQDEHRGGRLMVDVETLLNDYNQHKSAPQQHGQEVVDRALAYLRPHLESGIFSAPDWAIELSCILTGDRHATLPGPSPEAEDQFHECPHCKGWSRTSAQQPAEAAADSVDVCKWWQQDDGYDLFSTSCGHEYMVNDCTDGNVGLPYCPFCARRLEGHAWAADDAAHPVHIAPLTPPPAIDIGKLRESEPNDDGGLGAVTRHSLFVYEVDFGDEGKGRYVRLGDFNKVVASYAAACEPFARHNSSEQFIDIRVPTSAVTRLRAIIGDGGERANG